MPSEEKIRFHLSSNILLSKPPIMAKRLGFLAGGPSRGTEPKNIETVSKKKFPNERNNFYFKNRQFLPNLNETWSKLPAHDWVILTKFH